MFAPGSSTLACYKSAPELHLVEWPMCKEGKQMCWSCAVQTNVLVLLVKLRSATVQASDNREQDGLLRSSSRHLSLLALGIGIEVGIGIGIGIGYRGRYRCRGRYWYWYRGRYRYRYRSRYWYRLRGSVTPTSYVAAPGTSACSLSCLRSRLRSQNKWSCAI